MNIPEPLCHFYPVDRWGHEFSPHGIAQLDAIARYGGTNRGLLQTGRGSTLTYLQQRRLIQAHPKDKGIYTMDPDLVDWWLDHRELQRLSKLDRQMDIIKNLSDNQSRCLELFVKGEISLEFNRCAWAPSLIHKGLMMRQGGEYKPLPLTVKAWQLLYSEKVVNETQSITDPPVIVDEYVAWRELKKPGYATMTESQKDELFEQWWRSA